jgi:hypothetical protein
MLALWLGHGENVQGMQRRIYPSLGEEAYKNLVCWLAANHWLFQLSPSDGMTQEQGCSIYELLQQVLSVEAFLRSRFDLPWMNSEEFEEETPTILQRVDRILSFLQGKLTVPAAVAQDAIYKIIEGHRTHFQMMLPLSLWDRSRMSEDDNVSSIEDPPTIPSSGASTFPQGYQISNPFETATCQQSAVDVQNIEAMNLEYADGSKKGGRPPKQWPYSARRLLARFVTTAFPNLTVVEHAVKEDGFAVR